MSVNGILALAVLLTGCRGVESADEPNALPVIFISCDERVGGGLIRLDGKDIALLSVNTFFALEVKPGKHLLRFQGGSPMTLNCERGKRYYFSAWDGDFSKEYRVTGEPLSPDAFAENLHLRLYTFQKHFPGLPDVTTKTTMVTLQ